MTLTLNAAYVATDTGAGTLRVKIGKALVQRFLIQTNSK